MKIKEEKQSLVNRRGKSVGTEVDGRSEREEGKVEGKRWMRGRERKKRSGREGEERTIDSGWD
jgi:hypothetical protein